MAAAHSRLPLLADEPDDDAAISEGLLDVMIRHGARLHSSQHTALSALEEADFWQDDAAVNKSIALLSHASVDLDQTNTNGLPFLHSIVFAGRNAVARCLIEQKCDVNVSDGTRRTALDYAAGEMRDLLREHGAKSGRTPDVSIARHAGAGELMDLREKLVTRFLSPNSAGDDGKPAVIHAVRGKQWEALKLLVEQGAVWPSDLDLEDVDLNGDEVRAFVESAGPGLWSGKSITWGKMKLEADAIALDLLGQRLTPNRAVLLGIAIVQFTGSLTMADLRYNNLDTESATMLTTIAKEKKISLCGIASDQIEADFTPSRNKNNRMKPEDAILLTADLAVRRSLTECNVCGNPLDVE